MDNARTRKLLLAGALICFVLAAVGFEAPYVSLIPTGLALWVGTALI